MKNLPREWIAGAAAALLAVVFLLTAGGGETGGAHVVARGTYDAAPVPEPRWLPQDLPSVYPEGKDPTAPSTEWVDLPPEDLGVPEFPSNPLPNFPIRPSPPARTFAPRPVAIAAADLPGDDVLTALRAAGKTDGGEVAVEEEAIWDEIETVGGQKFLGKIIEEKSNGEVVLRLQGGKGNRTFKPAEIAAVRRGEPPEIEYAKRAAEASKKGTAKDHEELAAWCVERRLHDEAADQYEAALRLTLKATTLEKLSAVYALLSDPDREIRFYRGLLEKRPGSSEVIWSRLGHVYEALGLPTRATDAYVNATKAQPFHADARARLVAILSEEGRLTEAETHLTGMLGSASNQALAEAKVAAGTLLYFAGKLDAAKTDLAAAGPAGSHLLGCTEALLGNGAGAVAAFRAALESNPDSIDSWLNLGVLCALAGDAAKAQACFEEAGFRAPVSPHPWAAAGWLNLRSGKAAEAAAAFGDAIKRDARCAFALFGAGKLALDGGDPAAAEPQLLAALKAGAGPAAFRELGLARLRMKNTSGAVEALRRAADAAIDADSHALLGFALLTTHPAVAEQEFRRAAEMDLNHVLAGCGLAAVSYVRRDLGDARNRFEAVLARSPGHKFAELGKRLANEAATRRLWHDEFERKDGEIVRRTWVEKEKEGLRVTVSRGRAQFGGTQLRDDGITSMTRPTNERFLSFEAELDFTKAEGATAGITLGVPVSPQNDNPFVLRFVRTPDGRLQWWGGALKMPPAWKPLGDAPGLVVRLRIERATGAANNWNFLANGAVVGTGTVDLRGQKLEAGAYGFAAKGKGWELGVDNVRLIEAK